MNNLPENTAQESLIVCYFGTYREEYSRNKTMIEGLRRNNVKVIECHETLWRGIEDRVQTTAGGWRKPGFWLRVGRTYLRLIWRYLQTPDHDILIVGYPGQFDVYIARLLAWLRNKQLVWDVFMSIYLIAVERGLGKRSPFTVNLLRLTERWALRLPNLLIQDTKEYAQWLSHTHGINIERFRLVPTGADDRIFKPNRKSKPANREFQVIYYGTFIPNHGVEYIVEAAINLKAETEIKFHLIGDGPDRLGAESLAKKYALRNVKFWGWLEPRDLIKRAVQADICLGVFGSTPQSMMTIQNKIYEGLAMAQPVISGDSPTMRQVFKHRIHLYLCDRGNGGSLATAILDLKNDPMMMKQLAENGYKLYQDQYDLLHNGQRYSHHLSELLS